MNASSTVGDTRPLDTVAPSAAEFVRFSGTEKAWALLDTTACTDSLASMMANTLVVFVQEPAVFHSPGQQPRGSGAIDA